MRTVIVRFHLLTFVLLFCFVSTSFLYEKNEQRQDYVITLDNDTLHGYIDYKNYKQTPVHILFKESLGGSGFFYTPKTISGFYTAGKLYRSAIVKIDQSALKTIELTLFPESQFIIDTVFLQAIILGERELYYLKDSTGNESFYIKQDSKYDWLIYKKYQKKQKDKKLVVANNNYIGQLLLYLQNCPSINSVLSEATYDMKSLSKVYYYYYDCTNSKLIYREKEKKLKLFFWLK